MSAIKRLECLTINRCFKMDKWSFPIFELLFNCRSKKKMWKQGTHHFFFLHNFLLISFYVSLFVHFFFARVKTISCFMLVFRLYVHSSWTTKLFPFGKLAVWKSNRNVLSIKMEFSGCNWKMNAGENKLSHINRINFVVRLSALRPDRNSRQFPLKSKMKLLLFFSFEKHFN